MTGFPWKTAAKIAWREARASSGRFFFVVIAVALGVGALTGVRGFSQSFRAMLVRDARKLMAADLTIRQFSLPTTEQQSLLTSLASRGVDRTHITETLSMLSAGTDAPPVLVSIKAVDPTRYPFYGSVVLNPNKPLSELLTADAVVTSDDLLARLNKQVGDTLRIGKAEFHVAAIVVTEPDRMVGSLNVGPRLMINRAGLERTGLIVEGSRAAQRFLFRFTTDAVSIDSARKEMRAVFTEAQIIDYRETHPIITRGLDRSTTFLSLVSLIALLVGALGVAMAMHSHLQQKLDTIAVMKSLGARSGQIIRIYTLQTLILGIMGGLAGVGVGLLVQFIFPTLMARYFHLTPGMSWDPISALQGLAIGVLTTLLFTLPPLLGIRKVKPSLILRRDMEEARPDWRKRFREGRAAMLASGLILIGVLAIVWWLSGSARVAAYFVGGFAVSLLILTAIAAGLLYSLKKLARWSQTALPSTFRHGLANVYRPGNQASVLLVALGLGVMFTLTIFLVQSSMISQIAASAPPNMPNVFMINITPRDRDGITEILHKQQGIDGRAEVIPVVSVRMLKLDGVPVPDFNLRGFERRHQQNRSVTWTAELQPSTTILEGKWWQPADKGQAKVCVSEEVRKALPVRIGSRIDWISGSRNFTATVQCIYRSEAVRMGSNFEFLFSPGSLDGYPALHFAAIRIKPDQVIPLQKTIFARYPTVTVINGADVLVIIQEVVDQIALIIRFVSIFAILAGAIILSSSVAGSRFRRVREVVILKTLGATRGRIAGIFSVEFSILGAAAGILGSMLATAFSLLILKRLFQVDYRFDPWPHLACIVLTALLANLAGWLASHRILGQKPLEVLRESL